MKKSFLIEEITFAGNRCQIFSVKFEGESENEFDKFLKKYDKTHPKIIEDITLRIRAMKQRNGCLDIYFNMEVSSIYNSICRLKRTKQLRLYCIKYGKVALILGGGGIKSNNKRTYQEVPELNEAVGKLEYIYEKIDEKLKEKEIRITDEGIEGNLLIKIEGNDE